MLLRKSIDVLRVARALVCQSLRGADVEDCMQELYLCFKNMKQFKRSACSFRRLALIRLLSGNIDYVRSQRKLGIITEKMMILKTSSLILLMKDTELNPEARLDKRRLITHGCTASMNLPKSSVFVLSFSILRNKAKEIR